MRFVDVNGDSLIVKISDNEEISKRAFELFAKTSEGRDFLAQFAARGQVLYGHTFNKNGKYHQKGLDIVYVTEELFKGDSRSGEAGFDINTKQITVNLGINRQPSKQSSQSIDDYRAFYNELILDRAVTLFHESYIHAQYFAGDYWDDKQDNRSNVNEAYRDPIYKKYAHHYQILKVGDVYGNWPNRAASGLEKINRSLGLNQNKNSIIKLMKFMP